MPVIASIGAMLLSGHQKHQLEVGLSLQNLIQTSLTRLGALGQVFGTSDPDESARSTALIDPDFATAGLAATSRCRVASSHGAMSLNLGVELGCRMAGNARTRVPAQLADDGC